MSEGTDVRRAMDGPDLEHDALIDQLLARIAEEHARSADASESSAKTNAYVEKTGINTQALSWCKSILKKLPKKDGQSKAMDVIMSLETALPMIKAHVGGQGTADMFPEAGGDADKVADAVSDGEPADTFDEPEGDPDIAQDAEDFDAAASDVDNVTPISFGGEVAS